MSAEPDRDDLSSHPFIATAPARAALPPLLHGVGARAPFVLLTGDAGTGRSWLAAEWVERLGDRATPAVLPAPAPLASDMAASLVPLFDGRDEAFASTAAATEALMQALANATIAGRIAVIIADDADRLDDAQLLELRRIADAAAARQCPLEVLLIGAPAFAVRLESPAMRDVRARLSVHVPLARFSANDTREYLQSRLSPSGVPCMGLFSRKASRDIHQESLGLVGLIESIASESLRRAGREGSASISPEHVRAAARAVRSGRLSDDVHEPTPSQVRTRTNEPESESIADQPAPTPAAPAAPAKPAEAPKPAPAPVAAAKPASGTHARPKAAPAPAPTPTPTPAKPAAPQPVAASEPAPKPPLAPEKAKQVAKLKTPAPPAPVTIKPAPPVPVMSSHMSTPNGNDGSSDVRVQAWLAKFGGAGSVRVGAPQPGAALDEATLLAELNAQEAAEASGGEDSWPPKKHTQHSARGAAPPSSLRSRRSPVALAMPLVALLAIAAVGVLAFAQRGLIGRMVSAALAETRPDAARVTHAAPKPAVPVAAPVPTTQFSIAAGRYGTHDLARAEADYLGRLITPRVRVGNLRDGGARLLIGRFDTREQAQSALAGLQSRGLIPDASIIEVPLLAQLNQAAASVDTTATR